MNVAIFNTIPLIEANLIISHMVKELERFMERNPYAKIVHLVLNGITCA